VAPTCNTQEAEIRRILVRSQPRQIVPETLISKKLFTKKQLVEWLRVYVGSELKPQYWKKKKKYNVLGYTVKQVEPSSTAEDFRD
jgi:esterase/lipase superfamily enzyme